MTATAPSRPARRTETRSTARVAPAPIAGDYWTLNRSDGRESPSSTISLRRDALRPAARWCRAASALPRTKLPLASSLQNDLGEPSVVSTIGGAYPQQVFAGREAGQI